MSATAFRNLLEAGDVTGLRAAWSKLQPHLPQPESYEAAEVGMHMARTASEGLHFKHRAYSHRWLDERAMPSQLPDNLKPRAERLYPVTVEGVGISCTAKSELFKPMVKEVRGAMEYAVEDCFANGDRDPVLVKSQMMQARKDTIGKLLGRFYRG